MKINRKNLLIHNIILKLFNYLKNQDLNNYNLGDKMKS